MTPDMATKYDLVALLPMKANSERVKGKKFREFSGSPYYCRVSAGTRLRRVIFAVPDRVRLHEHWRPRV